MLRLMLTPVAFILLSSCPALAQEWIEYVSRVDRFTVNFPAEPTVRNITHITESGLVLPGHVHSHENGPNRYSVTVIDFTNIREIGEERVRRDCNNGDPDSDVCRNRWNGELRGAIDQALWSFLQRDAKVTDYGYCNIDLVEGRRIQLTNADRSRTFVAIHMHDDRLYILEGTVPAGAPPPGLFQQSLGFLDKDGVRVRYESLYVNGYPAPPRRKY